MTSAQDDDESTNLSLGTTIEAVYPKSWWCLRRIDIFGETETVVVLRFFSNFHPQKKLGKMGTHFHDFSKGVETTN